MLAGIAQVTAMIRNTRETKFALIAAAPLIIHMESAIAYVGPGTGLSAVGSFFAFLMAIILVIVGFFWLPLKRLYRKWRSNPELQESENSAENLASAKENAPGEGQDQA